MFSGTIGLLHFLTSVLALITGTIVLAGKKGSKRHIKIGYVYAAAMLVVLVTSFMLYNVHGTFGILHWLAVISSVSLLCGILPMIFKFPKTNYLGYHFSFMYWSVIGLYCALCAEILTRLPLLFDWNQDVLTTFYTLIGIATALVGGIGAIYFKKYKIKWGNFVEAYQQPGSEQDI